MTREGRAAMILDLNKEDLMAGTQTSWLGLESAQCQLTPWSRMGSEFKTDNQCGALGMWMSYMVTRAMG